MQQVTISLSGTDPNEIKALREHLAAENSSIKIEDVNLETFPGVVETLSILGITITVVSGIVAQVVGAWVYDLLKKKSPDAKVNLQVNGVQVNSQADIEKVLQPAANPTEPAKEK